MVRRVKALEHWHEVHRVMNLWWGGLVHRLGAGHCPILLQFPVFCFFVMGKVVASIR